MEIDHGMVGEPDWTRAELNDANAEMCRQAYARFQCTRSAGHSGHHVAGTGVVIACTWRAVS